MNVLPASSIDSGLEGIYVSALVQLVTPSGGTQVPIIVTLTVYFNSAGEWMLVTTETQTKPSLSGFNFLVSFTVADTMMTLYISINSALLPVFKNSQLCSA